MGGRTDWVLLTYRLPREPSNPRVVLWRKLRRLGAAQIGDGLVVLPADARTREQFDWLADEIEESRGTASIWIGRAGSVRQEQALVAQMRSSIAEEYQAILDAIDAALAAGPSEQRRTAARLRREIRRIAARDYFPPLNRDQARAAVEDLASRVHAEAER